MELGWKFREMQRSETASDPIEAEFFVENDDSDKLIREAIQNSLDVRLDKNKPVEFRVSFSELLDRKIDKKKYFLGLEKHLDTMVDNYDVDIGSLGTVPDFVVLEDFNTKGLCGDVEQFLDSNSGGEKNDYYYFWRNRGRSSKSENDRGRWGLGKRVFPHSSRINSFFGYTVRASDKATYLMGQSTLMIHQFDGKRYDSTGFFPKYDDFQLPIEDTATLESFRNDFKLTRKKESGLSIVVPYLNESITPGKIARSAISHYFFPIISGDLEVKIKSEDENYIINKKNIEEVSNQLNWTKRNQAKKLSNLFEMTRWILSLDSSEIINLDRLRSTRQPLWDEQTISDSDIELLTNKDIDGERLAIKVPIDILNIEKKTTEKSHFFIYLERDELLSNETEQHFIRQGLTIVGIKSFKIRGMRAIVNVEDGGLGNLLGDSENPAHTEWQRNQPKIKKYKYGPSIIDFVKNGPNKIVDFIYNNQLGRDTEFFMDQMHYELPQKVKKKRTNRKRKRGKSNTSGGVNVKVEKRKVEIHTQRKYDDGFKVTNKPSIETKCGKINVVCAYDTIKGNPFKQYSKFDFNLAELPIVISKTSAEIEIIGPNEMNIKPLDVEFEVEVIGFDSNRDLKVRTTELRR